ncbi:PD40 domain-containing protein [bacterium]|nr:MAG: PD40 domain-containing protein [bacterium]
MIKKIWFILLLVGSCNAAPEKNFTASARKYSTIKCLGLCEKNNPAIAKIGQMVKFDLEFTDQLDIELKATSKQPTPQALKKLFADGISLCLLLKEDKDKTIGVEVFDTNSGASVFKKSYPHSADSLVLDGHRIGNDLIPALTGKSSVALSTLAFCKQVSSKQKIICVADYACKGEKDLITHKTLNVAPAWHSQAPMLFYSQFTPTRCRLMAFNMANKHQQNICAYHGLNMQPSFSPDGTQVALCMSANSDNSEIYLYDQQLCSRLKKRVFRQLTHNKGNNSAPCLLPNGNLVFCSDFQTGNPQLYHLNRETNTVKRLSNGQSYCAAPTYNAKKNALAYTRYINGNFQLFSMDLRDDSVIEKQLTRGPGDKLDPAWSPCGHYIAFTYDLKNEETGKKIPQIATFNCDSKNIRILTHNDFPKSFPAWTHASLYQL